MSPAAAATVGAALTDLHEVSRHLAAGLPAGALDAETTARILDRLAAELAGAADMIRAAGTP